MKIIDGKKIGKDILAGVKQEVSELPFIPIFCDILVGNDLVSLQYVNLKKKKAKEVGMEFYEAVFAEDITTIDLINEIKKINQIPNMCGVIVQLPLPSHINTKEVLGAIDSNLDVDCLGLKTSNDFYRGGSSLAFPTALSCMRLLDEMGPIDGVVVVLGQGELVGKPVAELLRRRGMKHICVDSHTENSEDILKSADVIISGIGRENFIKADMIKDGVNIIDAGTSESMGTVVGDVDFDSVKDKVNFITPVPGGVGPVTVAMLLRNVLQVAKTKIPNE